MTADPPPAAPSAHDLSSAPPGPDGRSIGVVGSGSWGTALAGALADSGHPVLLWGRNPETIRSINEQRRNPAYLADLVLPEEIRATTRLEALADAPVILVVVPSAGIAGVAADLAAIGLPTSSILVSCTKGIEKATGRRMSQVLSAALPENPVAVLSGPNHAEEIARHMAAAAVIGSPSHEIAVRLQQSLFVRPWFRTYTSDDVVGIEWAGAVKNVFAIAAGISDGLGLGDNAKAALVTRGLAEMIRIGLAHGGRRETFEGLSGVGDLVATCYSLHSRNCRFGRILGEGTPLDAAVAGMTMVAEGVPNTESIHEEARRIGVETPLIDGVHAVLYRGVHPRVVMGELLARDPRPERDDLGG